MALAAMAPIAMASSVSLGQRRGELGGERRGRVVRATSPPMVTDAAPTTSRNTQDRNSPAAAKNPVRAGRHRRGQVAGVVGGVRRPAGRVAERGADRQQEAAHAADAAVDGGRAEMRLATGSTTDAIAKITASTGKVHRSNACTRLCPKKASAGLQQHDDAPAPSSGAMPNSVASANAPLTLLVANQPTPAVTDISTAGTALPLNPNGKPAEHHLRHAVQRAARGQEVVRDRAEAGADDDAERPPARSSCRRRRRRARRRRSSRTRGWARSRSRTAGWACRAGPPRRCIRCRPVRRRRSGRGRCRRSGRWVRSTVTVIPSSQGPLIATGVNAPETNGFTTSW